MANEKRPPGSQGTRRRRPPTVIDLEASEVLPETAAPQAPAASSAPPPPSDPLPKPDDAFIPPLPMTPSAAAFERASYEPPPPPPPEPPRVEPEQRPGRRPAFTLLPEEPSRTPLAAGIAGVTSGLLVVLLLWAFGAFSGGRDSSADLNPRLASIEQKLKDLAARPAPAAFDPKAINATLDDIAARLAKIEGAQAAPRAPVTDPVVLGRLNAAENAAKSLADNMAAMSRRADAIDASVRETNGRIEKLTAALGDMQTTVRAAAAGSDRASRLAVAASALRNAVERGDPFTAELAIVKPLAPDAGAIAVLEPFAASGVPGNGLLGQELAAIVAPLLRAIGEPVRDSNFLDRLQANAKQLVRIRPVDEEARGDDRGAILSRAEQRASQGNISGAMMELAKLPADARAPVQSWIARAETRNKALDAGRRLAADSIAALKAAP